MADELHKVAALRSQNDELRAQIDALKACEIEIRATNLHLRSALAAGSVVGAWSWHPARDVFVLDEGFARVFGLDETFVNVELPIDQVLVNLHPEGRPGLDAAIAEAVARGGAYVHQYRIKRSDGKYYWVEAHGRVDYDAEGTPFSFPGIVIDVSERRGLQAERNRAITALRESEARVRALLGQSSAGIAQTTLDGRFIFVNDRYCAMVGRSREALLTLQMHQITHTDNLPGNARQFQDLVQGGNSFEVEKRYLRPDGSTIWVRNSVTCVRSAEGILDSVFAVSIDISEQKAAELRQAFLLRLMDRLRIEHTANAIMASTAHLLGQHLGASRVGYALVQADDDTVIFEGGYVDGVAALTGSHALADYDKANIAAQRRGETVVVDDTQVLERREHWAAIDTGAFVSVPRIREGRFRAGFYVNHRGPHAWSADEILLIEEVATRTWDAVERAQAETALREANDTLEQRIRTALSDQATIEDALRQSQKLEAIGQLTGGVAHDFNNLLTVIKSSTELLKRPNLPDDRRGRYLQAITTTVDRAAKLTGQLLAFARRQALRPEVFAACDSVRSLSAMMETLTGARIEIVTELPEHICFINADASQFDTALVNMAVNARDAMDGEGRLTIHVEGVEVMPATRSSPARTGAFVAVSISDTGIDIPEEHLAQIFEPFFTTKAVGQGTGLGLSQVYGFARQSGGEVRVRSEIGKGSVFTLYLPRAAAAEQVQKAEEPEALVDGHGTCVLVVEDNVEVGNFAVQTLTDLGYKTVLANNAQEALVELAKDADRFDVVFSDVVMPGMSGIDLAHEIRRQHHDLPVLLASGYSHVLAQNGTYGFELLHKPYSIEQLSRLLRKVATGQRRQRILRK